jgi:hypothetical protein
MPFADNEVWFRVIAYQAALGKLLPPGQQEAYRAVTRAAFRHPLSFRHEQAYSGELGTGAFEGGFPNHIETGRQSGHAGIDDVAHRECGSERAQLIRNFQVEAQGRMTPNTEPALDELLTRLEQQNPVTRSPRDDLQETVSTLRQLAANLNDTRAQVINAELGAIEADIRAGRQPGVDKAVTFADATRGRTAPAAQQRAQMWYTTHTAQMNPHVIGWAIEEMGEALRLTPNPSVEQVMYLALLKEAGQQYLPAMKDAMQARKLIAQQPSEAHWDVLALLMLERASRALAYGAPATEQQWHDGLKQAKAGIERGMLADAAHHIDDVLACNPSPLNAAAAHHLQAQMELKSAEVLKRGVNAGRMEEAYRQALGVLERHSIMPKEVFAGLLQYYQKTPARAVA